MLPYICFYDAQGLATLIYEWRTMLFMRRNEGLVRYFSFHKADIRGLLFFILTYM